MAAITIASLTIPEWQGGSTGITLRIYNNASFTTPGNTFHPQSQVPLPGRPVAGSFYKEIACTVSTGALTIPLFTIDSTTDSTDNPDATYSAVLWDQQSGGPIQSFGTFSNFSLDPTPTTTTWAAIFAAAADV